MFSGSWQNLPLDVDWLDRQLEGRVIYWYHGKRYRGVQTSYILGSLISVSSLFLLACTSFMLFDSKLFALSCNFDSCFSCFLPLWESHFLSPPFPPPIPFTSSFVLGTYPLCPSTSSERLLIKWLLPPPPQKKNENIHFSSVFSYPYYFSLFLFESLCKTWA